MNVFPIKKERIFAQNLISIVEYNRDLLIKRTIYNMYKDAKMHCCDLKTDKGRLNSIDRFYKDVLLHEENLTPEQLDYTKELNNSLKKQFNIQ